MDQQALAEYRYRVLREVLGGSPVGEVAERFGTTRQSLHAWRKRFEAEGMPGLVDRSRRPKSSPSRLDAGVESLICQLRREHPRHENPSLTVKHVLRTNGQACPETSHRHMPTMTICAAPKGHGIVRAYQVTPLR